MKRTSLLFLISLAFSLSCLFYFEAPKAQSKSFDEDLMHKQPMHYSEETAKVKQVPQMIKNSKSAGAHFDQRNLFQSATELIHKDAQLREVLSDGVILNLAKPDIQDILRENVGFLTLPLPDGKGGKIELELVKVDIFAPGFTVRKAEPTSEQIDESLGIHYRGIVKGNVHSLAAISIFKNEVMGFYSTEADGNSILGRLGGNNATDKHILYAEKDLKVSSNFHCDTKDDGVTLPESLLQAPEEVVARCVRIYLEANYDLFLNKGSIANTTSYLTGMFNQSATLYSNDGIPLSISQIFVWNSASPYTGSGSQAVLEQFAATRTSFTGDLAHLITLDRDFGGRAYLNGLCHSYAVSDIDPTYNTVPTYSWTINVFAHETGHNLGSPHTHACAWNGNNTAIDACGPTAGFPYEGTCSGAPLPPQNGGTIMSYCHRLPSVGINFSLGFGTQPRNLIVNRFNAATCLADCGGGCTYSLNPTTRSFTAPGGNSSFDVITGSTCPWTATVNAPSLLEIFSRSQYENLFPPAINLSSQPLLGNAPASPQAVFLNSTPIIINDRPSNTNPPGTGSLYPSTINVSGMTGTITLVQAALNGVSHSFPDDVDVVLVGPGGQRVVLMSDVGDTNDMSGVDLTFEQTAAALPDSTQVTSGTYRPTNFNGSPNLEPGGIDNFPSPGPGESVYASDLGVFNGTSPNGAWKLYVVDDDHFDGGNIASGWALGILTSGGGTSWINITSGSSGTGNGTVNYSVAANSGSSQRTGTITVNGQVHTVTQAGTGGGCPSTSINPGQTLNGSLASSDCVLSGTNRYFDVYSFSGVAGQQIAATMDSSAFDTNLYLTNSANQILDDDNNSGPGTNSRIPGSSGFFTLPATGSYFLWASSATDNATGAYSVGLSQCTFSISSFENDVGPGTGATNFSMDAPSGCAWSAVSDSTSWLTTSSTGSGDGTVRYDYIANSSTSPRTGRITVGGQVHTVTQLGVGGAGNVRFSSTIYTANEGVGNATITVIRSGGTGTGTVSYSTSDGTATAGMDYTPASGTLIFPGSETSRSFDVTILDDTAFEGNESINLSLTNTSTSLTLGNPSTATLTIIDNDIFISGRVNYAGSATGVMNAGLSLSGSQSANVTTDANGLYAFDGLAPAGNFTLTPSKVGAVSGINTTDATRILQFIAGTLTLSGNQQMASDTSQNGTINTTDVTHVLNFIAGNPAVATNRTGEWRFNPPIRSYTALATNQVDQNYDALLLGEVSGNWNPASPSIEVAKSGGPVAAFGRESTASPCGAPPIQLSLPNTSVGSTVTNFTLPITIGDTTGESVTGYNIRFRFDPAVVGLQATPVSTTGTLSSGMSLSTNTNTAGVLTVVAAQANPLTGSGTLLNVNFTRLGAQGTSTALTWEVSELNDAVNDCIKPATPINGNINIAAPTAAHGVVSGRITAVDGTPVSGAVIRLTGSQSRKTITDANGDYRFDNVETAGFYTVTPSRANFNFSPTARFFSQLGGRTEAVFSGSFTGDALNPLDTAEYFVRQQYIDILGREPDEGGFNYWSDRILECGSNQACVNARRRDVGAAFFIEAEFQQTGSFIYGLYRSSLGRRPSYAEYSSDRQGIMAGGNPEGNEAALTEGFVQRAEFVGKYQANQTAESFVDALLQTVQQAAGVELDSDRAALIDQYHEGGNLTQSRSLVLRAVSKAPGFKRAEYNGAFVLTEYFGYLRRDPDPGGYDFWIGVLNNRDPGNFHGMVCAFITSLEYQERFSPIVTRFNSECGP